jgi:deoxyribodipyrimidine photo-lyase
VYRSPCRPACRWAKKTAYSDPELFLLLYTFIGKKENMPKRTALIWFRNDLRVHDHEALYGASSFDQVFPLYIFDPHWFGETSFGFPKTGAHRSRFLIESVQNLRDNLQKLDADLIVRSGDPASVIPTLVNEWNVDALFAYGEPASEEQAIEDAVTDQLSIDTRFFWGHSLFHLEDIPYEPDKVPKTYTNFRKQVEKKSEVRECFPNPKKIELPEGIDKGEIPAAADLGADEAASEERAVLPFKGGERAAAERLKHYFWDEDQLKSYKYTRNGLLGADYSSKFSPWLANGCLSPRKIYWEVKRYEKERKSNVSTYWMIFELIWRDYFRFAYLRHGTDYFKAGGMQQKQEKWSTDRALFDAWAHAETGIPFVDANMREINQSGFMSNRGRQNVASFLSQNLNLDWRMGAEYFESQLLDYDPYSNYGNWMYNSTVGHDSRNRYFNIVKQAQKYDENGEYVKHWLPELEGMSDQHIHEPWTLTEDQQEELSIKIGEDYPEPMIDLESSYEEIRDRR